MYKLQKIFHKMRLFHTVFGRTLKEFLLLTRSRTLGLLPGRSVYYRELAEVRNEWEQRI